jgi:hypothetical protein
MSLLSPIIPFFSVGIFCFALTPTPAEIGEAISAVDLFPNSTDSGASGKMSARD